jgi:hypothetical protein
MAARIGVKSGMTRKIPHAQQLVTSLCITSSLLSGGSIGLERSSMVAPRVFAPLGATSAMENAAAISGSPLIATLCVDLCHLLSVSWFP